MVKLHLELEGDVGEVVRVLRRIGGGDNEGGEVPDGPRPAPVEERTSAVDTVPEPGTTATFAALVPGHWTEELAVDFTSGLDVVARRVIFQVWRAGAAGIHRNTLCQRTDLSTAELSSLVMRMGHVLGRFRQTAAYQRERFRCRIIAAGLFASLDRLGWDRSRRRGLGEVDCEGYMAALAHNVLKMIRRLGCG